MDAYPMIGVGAFVAARTSLAAFAHPVSGGGVEKRAVENALGTHKAPCRILYSPERPGPPRRPPLPPPCWACWRALRSISACFATAPQACPFNEVARLWSFFMPSTKLSGTWHQSLFVSAHLMVE